MKTDRILSIIRIAALVLICLTCLVPFYVLLVLALNSPSRIFYEGNIFVPDFFFSNFIEAWHESRIGQAMVNSAIITSGTLALAIVLGGLAGYAIAHDDSGNHQYRASIHMDEASACCEHALWNDSCVFDTCTAICGIHIFDIHLFATHGVR